MEKFNPEDLKKLYKPSPISHKGQNGKLMIIGGSHLFHGASLFALKVASRIVDMVFYSSTLENNRLTEELKNKLYDFIAIPRNKINDYIKEADVILIGSGLPREEGREEGEESTRELVQGLLSKYPNKKWVLDAGAITEIESGWLLQLNGNVILTPHHKEFELLKLKIKNEKLKMRMKNLKLEDQVGVFAKEYNSTILLKGQVDLVCPSRPSLGEAGSPSQCSIIEGGNEGMTKGGTGDVLAGLVAALACKNDLFLAACAGSFINKKAGDSLYQRVGPYFNASDLADEIPTIMNQLIIQSTNQPINK